MRGSGRFDGQQPAFDRNAAWRREAAGSAAGRHHAMARYDDCERVSPQCLTDGSRQSPITELRSHIPVGERRADRNRSGRFVNAAVEGRTSPMSSTMAVVSTIAPPSSATTASIACSISEGGAASYARPCRCHIRSRVAASVASATWRVTMPCSPHAMAQRLIAVSKWVKAIIVGRQHRTATCGYLTARGQADRTLAQAAVLSR